MSGRADDARDDGARATTSARSGFHPPFGARGARFPPDSRRRALSHSSQPARFFSLSIEHSESTVDRRPHDGRRMPALAAAPLVVPRSTPRVRRARPGVSSARTSTSASAVSSSEKTMSAAPAFKLVYFDLLAKGLPVAMVAAHSGLSWEGKDRDSFDWKTVKANQAPFDQMPLLFLPDGRVVAQSTAIAHVIVRLAGPARDYDGAAASDADFDTSAMLLAEAEDIYAALQRGQPTKFVPVGEGGKTDATHAELWADDGRFSLPRHLRCLEALIGPSGDAFTASGTTAGEMYLWGMLHQIAILDGSTFAATPGVDAFHRRIRDLPLTRDVLEGRSPMGEMEAYFLKGPIR